MEITKSDLQEIKEYLQSEYPEPRGWRLSSLTTITDKTLIEDDKIIVMSYIYIRESDHHRSVFMNLTARPVDWDRSFKVNKLSFNVNILDLKQLKAFESEAENLFRVAKSLSVWK